jgi:Na+/melibiose symporter-like transporter
MFREYLQSIKPTWNGTKSICLIVIIIPVIVDVIALPVLRDKGGSFTVFVFGNYLPMIALLVLYLLIFYFAWEVWIKTTYIINNEKFEPGPFEFENNQSNNNSNQ